MVAAINLFYKSGRGEDSTSERAEAEGQAIVFALMAILVEPSLEDLA